MPSISTTSLSAATASTSSTSLSKPSHDPRNAVVGGILGVMGSVLLVGIVFLTLRVRRRQKNNGGRSSGPFQGTAVLDKNHPATRIVPFGTPGHEGHYFSRVPGKDMRIAIRRPDGAWDFTDPSEPFTPSGISDVQPSPVSSTASLIPSSKLQQGMSSPRSPILEYKEQESRAAQMIRLGYDARDNDMEMSDAVLAHPPPAYGHEPVVGPYVTYRPPGHSYPLPGNIPR